MDKRSNIYSSRQDLYVGQILGSGGLRILMLIRRMYHTLLNVNASSSYVPYQMLENKQMLNDMLDDPTHFLEHVQRYAHSLTTNTLYGWRTPRFDNSNFKQLFEGFEKFCELNQTGASALVDCFPTSRILPDWILPVKKAAEKLHQKEKTLYMEHWIKCKNAMRGEKPQPCFCVNMAKMQVVEDFSDDLASYTAGSLLEAGSDTTSATLYTFIQAMIVSPEIRRRAQEEIDRVVGTARLPTIEDEPKLQYNRACVKESLRSMPTGILAFPHAVIQNDHYKGYRIPAAAGVVCNVYTINMDPTRYPGPRRFNPDRNKDDHQTALEAATNANVRLRDQFTFGAGRGVCPGMHVAEKSLFLGISRLLWAFDIAPEKNDMGNDVMPDTEQLTQGFTCRPVDFHANITTRSEQRAEVVRRE